MAIVELLDESEYDDHVLALDKRVRQYTGAPGFDAVRQGHGPLPRCSARWAPNTSL